MHQTKTIMLYSAPYIASGDWCIHTANADFGMYI